MKKYISTKHLYLWLLLLLTGYPVFGQQQMFSGSVNDEFGNPVANAMVTIKGQSGIGVYTDNDGKFSILGQPGETLEVTTLNRDKRTFKLDNAQVAIIMDRNDALVPIGNRMEMRKEELTSAVGIVRANQLNKRSVFNPENALYGMIPGLTVLQNGGTNWSSTPDMYIRGIESFGIGSFVNTKILVLVDGFEMPMSSLSMAEIESVTVLKDAAALAMYGMRGANGVLLVTTRKGAGQGLSVDVNYERGVTRAFRIPKFLDAYGYANSVNQARVNDGMADLYTTAEIDRYYSGVSPYLYPNVDWQKESLRDLGSSNKFNISFQEQANSVRYFAVMNYDQENGLLGPVDANEGYSTQSKGQRLSLRGNIDINLTNSTTLSVKLSGNIDQAFRPSAGDSEADIFSAIYNTPASAYPVNTFNSSEKGFKNWGGTTTYGFNNPVAMISATGFSEIGKRELATDFVLEQDLAKILPGLSAEAGVSSIKSFYYADMKTMNFQYEQMRPIVDPNTGNVTDTASSLYGTTPAMVYSTNIPSQWGRSAFFADFKYAKSWDDNNLNSMLLLQMDEFSRTGQNNTFRHMIAAGTVHYGKAGKYFADLSLSYNGTNVLPEGKRTGFFPAVSVGWDISDEAFLADNSILNYLKLRASWGMTGNDQLIQNIDETSWISSAGYYFYSNNTSAGGYKESRFASNPLTYETSYKTNIGFDMSMFKILDLTVDAFYDKRKGILVETGGQVSGVLGVSQPYSSSGITTNKGVEMGLNLHKETGSLQYHLSGQFSYVKSKIVDMLEIYRPEEYLKRTGQPIGQAFGLEAAGFIEDVNTLENKQTFSIVSRGDILYKDQNGDHIINSYDEKPIGYNTMVPEIYYSGTVGLEFKGVGFDVQVQGIANQTLYLNTPGIFIPLRNNANISTFSADAWTPETAATATLPRHSMLENANNYRPNSIWYADGSFLKVRSVELYFDFPKQLLSRLKVNDARLYLRGMNLYSFDKIEIVDPEEIGLTHPTMSSYNLGIQIGF